MRAFTTHLGHEFRPDDVTLLDDRIVRPERLTPTSTTDVYLLLLAQQHDAKLATFDRRLPVNAIDGGAEAIEVIVVRAPPGSPWRRRLSIRQAWAASD